MNTSPEDIAAEIDITKWDAYAIMRGDPDGQDGTMPVMYLVRRGGAIMSDRHGSVYETEDAHRAQRVCELLRNRVEALKAMSR